MPKKPDQKKLIREVELIILKNLKKDLIPLACAVYKAEMLSTTDLNLRHKAASEVLELLKAISSTEVLKSKNTQEKESVPLINLNFPQGYLEKTFTGMADLIQKGDKNVEKPKTIEQLAGNTNEYL